jgi:hypothetical protein
VYFASSFFSCDSFSFVGHVHIVVDRQWCLKFILETCLLVRLLERTLTLLGSLTFVNLDRRQVLNFDLNYKYLFKTKPQRTMYNSFHLKGVFGYLGEEKEWVGMIGIKSIYDL